MGDEQQSCTVEPGAQRAVVEGSHDRLASTGGGDEQVAVMASSSRQLDQFEQTFLEGERAQLDRAEDDAWSAVGPPGAFTFVVELNGIVRNELVRCPVALEHCAELGNHVWVSAGGHADVPLQSRDLCRVSEVRRTDVGRREARPSMKHPRLRMKPGGAEIVRDADLRAEADELVKRPTFGRVRVRGREHAQFVAGFAMTTQ